MIQTALFLFLMQGATYRTGIPPEAPSPAYRPSPAQTPPATYRIAPAVAGPPPPELARTGVLIDSYDRRVESRWGQEDPFYAATIRGGAAAAQSRQGPMDGGWTVAADNGAALYALQIVDGGDGPVEGAWRGLAAAGGAPGVRAQDSGFMSLISRDGAKLVFSLHGAGDAAAPLLLSVVLTGDGLWRGEIARGAAPPAPIALKRR